MRIVESYAALYARLEGNPSLAVYLGDVDMNIPHELHVQSSRRHPDEVLYKKFKQSCRFLAQDVSTTQLVWVSLQSIWPEYGQYFWPGLDITTSLSWLTANETKSIKRDLTPLPVVPNEFRLVALLFWNFQKEITNISLVRKENIEAFALSNHAHKKHVAQSADGNKFWERMTCKRSYKHWFDRAVRELDNILLASTKRIQEISVKEKEKKKKKKERKTSEGASDTPEREVLAVLLDLAKIKKAEVEEK